MKKNTIIELLICFSAFVFWAFFYPGHVLMKEQFSFFLYTQEFWGQHALRPGGWSAYCGMFLAQFYINHWVGALIQTLLCAVLLILSKRIIEKTGASGNLLFVAVLPAMLLFALQCDFNFTTGNALVFICPFALMLLYMNMKRVALRRLVFTLVMVPVCLFSGAAATCCLYALCVIFEWLVAKDRWKYVTTAWLVVAAFLPYVWQTVYLTSIDKLFQILDFTLIETINYVPVVLLAWIPFCILMIKLVPLQRLSGFVSGKIPAMIIILLLIFCGYFLFPKTYSRIEEQKFRMYLAVVENDWDRALKTGKQIKTPDQHAAWLINLSLSMKGELPEKMFNYPQTNEYGLLPVRESVSFNMLYGSAFYYHIGILNDAIRWIYDSHIIRKRGMDYHTLTRLALWNQENGYEKAAEKYFAILSHTLMYRSFAKRQREASVTPRVATSEQVEFYIGGREPLSDMAHHYENNYKNTMILDYLLCFLLMKNDLDKFQQLYTYAYQPPKVLPKVYQEALLEMAKIGMIDIRRYPINPINSIRYQSFNNLVAKGNNHKVKKLFGDTWWNYSYRKKRGENEILGRDF